MSVTFNTHIGLLTHLAGMHYLFIPKSVIDDIGGSLKKRIIVTVNGKIRWQGGFMPLGEGNAYISISAKRMKELGINNGDTVQVELTEDTSKYGVEVPEELQAVFKQDAEAYRRFENLKPGMQRYVINYVATVKNSAKRIDRALMLMANLKFLKPGKETFREMLGLSRDR